MYVFYFTSFAAACAVITKFLRFRLRYDYDPTTVHRVRLLPVRRKQKMNMSVFRCSRIVVESNHNCDIGFSKRRYCVARLHAVTCVSVCPPTAHHISLGGEGNALYLVLSSFIYLFLT